MKSFKIFLKICFFVIILLIIVGNQVLAQTKSAKPTSTPTPVESEENQTPTAVQTPETINKLKQIELLKEKIATRVAQIRENEKGGFAGPVKKIDAKLITVADRRGDKIFTMTEDTVFYSLAKNTKAESSLAKLKEGDTIALLGYYNETKDTFSGKYVFIQDKISHLIGKITDIDKSDYAISVKLKDGLQTVDIETYTKINSISQTTAKIGFSKLKIGDTIHAFAVSNPKDADRVSATRITVLSALESLNSTASATISPSTTTVATPSSTPKTAK